MISVTHTKGKFIFPRGQERAKGVYLLPFSSSFCVFLCGWGGVVSNLRRTSISFFWSWLSSFFDFFSSDIPTKIGQGEEKDKPKNPADDSRPESLIIIIEISPEKIKKAQLELWDWITDSVIEEYSVDSCEEPIKKIIKVFQERLP
jgi:hypothetical protein